MFLIMGYRSTRILCASDNKIGKFSNFLRLTELLSIVLKVMVSKKFREIH